MVHPETLRRDRIPVFRLLSRALPPWRYLALVLGLTVAAFGGGAGLVHLRLEQFTSASNRMLDPRRFPDSARATVIRHFLDRKLPAGPDLLILGDSQPYGINYPHDRVFARLIEARLPGRHALNLSFRDARLADMIGLVDELRARGVRFRTVICNLEQSHAAEPAFRQLDPAAAGGGYTLELLKDPYTWFRALRRETRCPMPEELTLEPYGPDYWARLDNPAYDAMVIRFIDAARTISDQVVLYVTPHAPGAVRHNGYSMAGLAGFAQRMQTLAAARGVVCLDPQPEFADSDFFDIVHFNSKGHAHMAQVLALSLAAP